MKSNDLKNIPGWDLLKKGLKDISRGQYSTIEALLIFMAAPRLRFNGMDIPHVPYRKGTNPSHKLYSLLENTRTDAHSEYNALQRRLISFCHALENAQD